jgi:predicted NBD/HSP70 family sugar kinase
MTTQAGRIGFDIGGSALKAVRLGAGGEATRARVGYCSPTLETLRAAIRRAADELEITPGDRIGVCAPGVLDMDRGVVRYAANLPCLAGVCLRGLVRDALGERTPSSVMTDAVATALGSFAQRPVEGRLLTLAMGTGVGAALLEHGRPLTLDGATIGHLGQMDVSQGEASPPIGPDGGRGSLEAYVGWPALVARFGEAGAAASVATLPADDPVVRALVRALRVCHALYKPDVVRLLGGVGSLFAPIVPMLHGLTADGLTRVARPGWRLEAMDDPYLAAFGAASSA